MRGGSTGRPRHQSWSLGPKLPVPCLLALKGVTGCVAGGRGARAAAGCLPSLPPAAFRQRKAGGDLTMRGHYHGKSMQSSCSRSERAAGCGFEALREAGKGEAGTGGEGWGNVSAMEHHPQIPRGPHPE